MFEKANNNSGDLPARRTYLARRIGAWMCGASGLLMGSLLMADLENKMPYLDMTTAYKATGTVIGACLAHKLGLFESTSNQNN